MVTLNMFFGSESFIIAEIDFFLRDQKNWANSRHPQSVDLYGTINLFTLSESAYRDHTKPPFFSLILFSVVRYCIFQCIKISRKTFCLFFCFYLQFETNLNNIKLTDHSQGGLDQPGAGRH